MRIDAHQHFWEVARGDYGWLTPDLGAIYRDFGPDDLAPLLRAEDIDGTVLVQAAPTVAETEYMLSIAEKTPFVLGVVGWVDFEAADAPDTIARLARDPALKGLRPMIQDIADDDWMLRPGLDAAFRALIDADLTFDALTLPRHLPNLLTLLKRYPEMRVVIDHASKPEIEAGRLDPWRDNMAALAATSAFVKLSGLVTEAGSDWTTDHLRPVSDHLLGTFTPSRMIWGSDWPVCTLASSYADWCQSSRALLSGLSETQRAAIMGGNAVSAYRLTAPAPSP